MKMTIAKKSEQLPWATIGNAEQILFLDICGTAMTSAQPGQREWKQAPQAHKSSDLEVALGQDGHR